VLHSDDERALKRSVRKLRRQVGIERAVALDRWTVCVEPEDPPSARTGVRLQRRLGASIEARLDCDVAWAPLGRGFVLYTVAQPALAPELEAVLDASGPAFRDVIWPSDPAQPVRVCLPRLALADPLALVEAMRAQDLDVLAVYEVGGCRR
jgi:hypothetical protein